jgi:hypothetical protein
MAENKKRAAKPKEKQTGNNERHDNVEKVHTEVDLKGLLRISSEEGQDASKDSFMM